jgi:hypothetical protein
MMGRLFRSLWFALVLKRRFDAFQRPYNEREAKAIRRGCTQDVGHIRRDRRNALHAALRQHNDRSQSV